MPGSFVKGSSGQVNHRWVDTVNPRVQRCKHCDLRRRKFGNTWGYARSSSGGLGLVFTCDRPDCVTPTPAKGVDAAMRVQ